MSENSGVFLTHIVDTQVDTHRQGQAIYKAKADAKNWPKGEGPIRHRREVDICSSGINFLVGQTVLCRLMCMHKLQMWS